MMKKALALIMALAMMFSLCACTASLDEETLAQLDDIESRLDAIEAQLGGEVAEETEETEETAEETEEAFDFTWNGNTEVWSILPVTSEQGLLWINNTMGAIMEAEGWTYVIKDSQGVASNQVTFVEDAIAAGNVGALMIAAMDVDLLTDVVAEAAEAGIAVAMLGADPDYTIAGNVYTAYSITGYAAVLAAEDWVQQRVAEGGNIPTDADGKYEVAVDTYYNIRDGVYRSNAIKGTIAESDILVEVQETSAYGDDSTVTAYNNAQDVLGAHPDCHIFIAYEPAMANGIAQYLEAYCEDNDLDLADYCVIPCYGEDEDFLAYWAAAQEDASATAVKGYSTYGDPAMPYGDETAAAVGQSYEALAAYAAETMPDAEVIISPFLTGERLADILLGVCEVEGYEWTYGETYFDSITAVNNYGYSYLWSFGDEHPAAQYEVTD